jgi:putative N6-adenine-specific DNA methylase
MKKGENFKIIATTFKGLEKVLKREVMELGGQNPRELVRAVEFYGDDGFIYKANLKLSTAIRILKPIAHLRNIKSVATLYNKIYEIPWEKFFYSRKRIYFNVSGVLDTIPDTRFVSQKTKDALVDRFRDRFGHRPDIDKENPEVVVNLHLFRNQIAVSLDSSGKPLFKRGYREQTGFAPLNEVLAAGLLRLARWNDDTHLIDPMTGSGTIPIEAALMAANIPPNIYRDEFAFMHWHGFDKDLYNLIRKSLLDRIKEPTELVQIIGYDKDPEMIATARKNAEKAGVDAFVRLEVKDFFDTRKIPGPVTLIFNPPYDKRLHVRNRDEFYQKIANHLNEAFPWTKAWLLTPENIQKYFGRKPMATYKLINGKIPVNFTGFEL